MNKHHVDVPVDKNAIVDEADGFIRFPGGLTITDDSEQRNGTKYDIDSMDLSEYKGQLTADHVDSLSTIIGKVSGLAKRGSKVTIDGIKYAVSENPFARLAYNLLKNGFSTDFSIETYGEPVGNDGIYKDAKLIGLSQVVVGNNKSATLNNIVLNSIEQSKQDGLDVSEVEAKFKINSEHKDSNNKEKQEMSDKTDDKKPVDNKVEDKKVESKVDNQKEEKTESQDFSKAISDAVKPLQEQLESYKEAFSKSAQAPEFKADPKATNGVQSAKDKYKDMPWQERAVNQIESFRRLNKQNDHEAGKKLFELNEYNLAQLKKEGVVTNDITIGDLGNYVISPEQLSEIQGFRSDYTGLVNAFPFRETLSRVTQWLKRSGDIDMTTVTDDTADITSDDYLKPVSDYNASLETMELEELAAVTPVANSATRFLAADILSDVNAGYRTDYDRKRAQLIIARLEQAVDSNGNSESYTTTSDVNAVKDFANVLAAIAEQTPNGQLIMNHKSYWEFVRRATGAGISGPLANLVNSGSQPNIFGIPVLVVPNDLLPTLNTAETVAHTVDGGSVNIGHAVFYVNPQNFVGRISGGLMYDLSTDASYEVSGTVRSAFQRNQIVLRGAFYRGGQVADTDKVSGLLSEGVS